MFSAFLAFVWHSQVVFSLGFCKECFHCSLFKCFPGIHKSYFRRRVVKAAYTNASSLRFGFGFTQTSHYYCEAVVFSAFQTFRWHSHSCLGFISVASILYFSIVSLAFNNCILANVLLGIPTEWALSLWYCSVYIRRSNYY